jgi:hypothetical protein
MYDPDNDRIYRRPKAWSKAKEAFGIRPGIGKAADQGGDPGRAMVALEDHCRRRGGCVRTTLAVAMRAFLALDEAEKNRAYKAFSQGGTQHPRVLYEQLPESEREAYAADFEIAMKKLFGRDA